MRQTPWLDNLTRDSLDDGSLRDLVEAGIRGVTANPSIFAQAMAGSDAPPMPGYQPSKR